MVFLFFIYSLQRLQRRCKLIFKEFAVGLEGGGGDCFLFIRWY